MHVDDLAILLELALTKGESGSTMHGFENGGISTKDIASHIAEKMNLPVKSIPRDQAGAHFQNLRIPYQGTHPIVNSEEHRLLSVLGIHRAARAPMSQKHATHPSASRWASCLVLVSLADGTTTLVRSQMGYRGRRYTQNPDDTPNAKGLTSPTTKCLITD